MEALTYIVYIMERYYFSLVCTSRKVIDFFEVKIDIQKGAPKFRQKLTIDVFVSSDSCFYPISCVVIRL